MIRSIDIICPRNRINSLWSSLVIGKGEISVYRDDKLLKRRENDIERGHYVLIDLVKGTSKKGVYNNSNNYCY